jgi:transcriptional regulator with XRE-family HTH domain
VRTGYKSKTIRFYRDETLAQRIKKARRYYRLSQEDLEILCGISHKTIGRIEGGDDCRVSTLVLICIALDVDLGVITRHLFDTTPVL